MFALSLYLCIIKLKKLKNMYEDYSEDGPSYREMMEDTWDAMTDGQFGDMPEGFDGDFDFLGY